MKAAAEADLTFATPDDSGFPYVLFFCVFGSLLAHAATFFLFQVVYPQRVTIPQPAPHVSLLTPTSPENIALLRWVEAEDPALIANDNPLAPPGLATVQYHPSFLSARTAPLGVPAETVPSVRFPPAEDRLVPSASAKAAVAGPVHPVPATAVVFSGALAERSAVKNPAITFHYHAPAPVQPTMLLVGVNSQGEVRFSVPQQSSGDEVLDQLAVAHLRDVTFATASEPVTWGFATFDWGSDAYGPASKSP